MTSFDNLRAVETKKKPEYDLLDNLCGVMHGYKTRLILYVMAFKGIVTTFHK